MPLTSCVRRVEIIMRLPCQAGCLEIHRASETCRPIEAYMACEWLRSEGVASKGVG